MRISPHQANGPHVSQQRQGGGQRAPAAAAPAPQDTFQAQSPQAAYQAVSGALGDDRASQQALRGLYANGQLNGPLLDQLGRLAQPGSGNAKMLAQVVKDVAAPGNIRQGQNDFCGATAALSGLARNDPASYARIAADLQLTGRSTMVDGKVLQAKPDKRPNGMTATQGLMAPALTEAANGRRYRVDGKGVSHAASKHAPGGDKRVPGTYASGMERMQEMLQGQSYQSLYLPGQNEHGRGKAAREAQHAVTQSVASGEQASVNAGGHWYRVSGAGGGQLTVQDQQSGQTSTVDAKQFLGGAESVTFAAGSAKVAKDFRKHGKHEDPGGNGSGPRSSNPVEDARVR
ncbi:MAG TPA: hypothetical protein VIG99_28365 [Myxococcaceae bacterium]|jgi:hypothetical protein